MTFLEAIKACYTKFADFSGRSRRKEYWYFTLLEAAVNIAMYFVFGFEQNWIAEIVEILVFLPGIAVTWRRLHDIGRKGTRWLLCLIPVVGWIIVICDLCKDSQPGDNEYGPNPKGV